MTTEIVCQSIRRNATHGQQLSRADKQRLAGVLWLNHLGHMPSGERTAEIMALLSVSRDSVERWTKDARQFEKQAKQDRAWDLWLDCWSERDIAEKMGVDHETIGRWLAGAKSAIAENAPPASRQHFDSWSFARTDADESGFFGKMPPQVVEKLLWFFTEPGDIVVDLFAGSGTTIDVTKAMGPYSNYAVEMSARDALQLLSDVINMPAFFVFDDFGGLTPRDVAQRGTPGPDNSTGSGTPYLLVRRRFARPFDGVFQGIVPP